jgi:group I intron endonuclease
VKFIIENNITDVGIYELRCNITNKVYIGSSKNISKRIREHINNLRKNKHGNSYLQRAWKKYSENSFTYKCLENLPRRSNYKKILNIEQKYLDSIEPWKEEFGYNINKIADKPPRMIGIKHPMYGKHHTEEAKAKMRVPRPSLSIANKGKTMSERLGREWVNPLKGKKRTGWVSPCLGKKRTGWVSPCLDQTPLTLKHVNGEIKTMLKRDWVKQKVRYLYLLKKYKQGKKVKSLGWYYDA